MRQFEINRSVKIIDECISFLELNLNGKVVLTEVGSGVYGLLPFIALRAGADHVYAYSVSNNYGSSGEKIEFLKKIINQFDICYSRITFRADELVLSDFSDSDIITNSNSIRPLDSHKLTVLKSGSVIPLMYERWELRDEDIDVNFCKRKGIKIAGTWEDFPGLNIFQYCQNLIMKISFDAGFEIYENKIIVWSNDNFGKLAEKGFKLLGAKSVFITTSFIELMDHVKDADFIFFCDYTSREMLIGENGILNLREIRAVNPNIAFVHLSGSIEADCLKEMNFFVYPNKKGESVRMTYTLSYLGILPTLKLMTAGLKVGELLHKPNEQYNSLKQPIS